MEIIPLLLKEFDQEAQTTRKMLERVPNDKYSWKPHEKSMTIQQLATHVAELPSWVTMALNTEELDFAKTPYQQSGIDNTEDLLKHFETALASGKASLSSASEDQLLPKWTLRNGEQVYTVLTKYEVIRHALAQTIHHRAQLGVFLRLLNVPIPGTYGPSADEQLF
ncbi:MAG: DinB family protein [Chitinophagales bacterium]|nr:DinB family protein [Chitinophagales bacterium]